MTTKIINTFTFHNEELNYEFKCLVSFFIIPEQYPSMDGPGEGLHYELDKITVIPHRDTKDIPNWLNTYLLDYLEESKQLDEIIWEMIDEETCGEC